ncbi:hypothetical protein M404DRAFT_628573 [Pisolithus tinctorius Marx 270]|uniref:Uncharacterized protein n=1 Tax=Pisolithus tinctorius Marx 270 TaxID=870435 RepID=A0A0C3K030_PISTI|nr:hypothetical protein M404DRAFT_852641 [Pisolithus tinctorius Marx 270]KIO02972.1 hypothetical protein M404DRAFT_628573 [Pisolithus tinctorius Marx 270]
MSSNLPHHQSPDAGPTVKPCGTPSSALSTRPAIPMAQCMTRPSSHEQAPAGPSTLFHRDHMKHKRIIVASFLDPNRTPCPQRPTQV